MNSPVNEVKKTFKGCGFGVSGNCCNICFLGPCRLDPFTETQHGKCNFDRLRITTADLLMKCNYQLGRLLDDSLSDKQMNMNLLKDTIIKSLKWVSKGGEADESEGADLLMKASSIIFDADLNYAKAGRNDKIPPEYKAIYMVGNEDININSGMLKDKEQNYKEVSKGTVFSLLGKEDFINSKNDITLVCDEPDLSIWPILCGLGSAGYTVVAQLPLPIKINRGLLDIINELLNSGSDGRIIEFSSNQ